MVCYRVRCEIRHINRPSTIGWYKEPGKDGLSLTLDETRAKIWTSRKEADALVAAHPEYAYSVEELGVQ